MILNGSHVQDPVKMANAFDKFFVNMGASVDKSIPCTKKSPSDYLEDRNPKSSFLAPVASQEIQIIVNSLNKNKSTGSHSIPIFLLKISSSCMYISVRLATLVNSSFETGVFPEKLKLGKVKPLHKKESTQIPCDYRPISV